MADMMDFPETIEEFLDSYAFVDKEEVYTNGSMLIPLFRVKQGLEHYVWKLNNEINRQKVENESLKQIIDEQDKEVIKLQNRIIFWREDLNYQPEKIKSEAIKEFAEKLKRYSVVDNLSLDGKETVYVDDINNLVKEMTEVDK